MMSLSVSSTSNGRWISRIIRKGFTTHGDNGGAVGVVAGECPLEAGSQISMPIIIFLIQMNSLRPGIRL